MMDDNNLVAVATEEDEERGRQFREARATREKLCEDAARELRKALDGRKVMIIAEVGSEFIISFDVHDDEEPEGPKHASAGVRLFLADHLTELLGHDNNDAFLEDFRAKRENPR